LSVKAVGVEIPLLPLLTGRLDLSGLTVDGLKVAIDLPRGRATEVQGVKAIAEFVGNVVHSGSSSNFELHDATLDITDRETGFTIDYAFDAVVSKAMDDGSVDVDAKGRLNGKPWKLSGCEGDDCVDDAQSLYDKLEHSILPIYSRNPDEFRDIRRHCIALNGSFFNTQRMLQQYVLKAYFE